jgi:hypothetical protein
LHHAYTSLSRTHHRLARAGPNSATDANPQSRAMVLIRYPAKTQQSTDDRAAEDCF